MCLCLYTTPSEPELDKKVQNAMWLCVVWDKEKEDKGEIKIFIMYISLKRIPSNKTTESNEVRPYHLKKALPIPVYFTLCI